MIKTDLALIFCGDCQKEYSDYALACPVCSRPTDTQVINNSVDKALNYSSKKNFNQKDVAQENGFSPRNPNRNGVLKEYIK